MAQPTEKRKRRGRVSVINGAGWVELSLHPHGKKAAIPRYSIQGIAESHVEGVGCFVTYQVGQAVTNIPVLDLYLPLVHKVLDEEAGKADEQGCWTDIFNGDPLIQNDNDENPWVQSKSFAASPDIPVYIHNADAE